MEGSGQTLAVKPWASPFISFLVSSSVKQILGDTQGLRSFMKLLKGAQNRVWLRK